MKLFAKLSQAFVFGIAIAFITFGVVLAQEDVH